jgi:hypothetical protein
MKYAKKMAIAASVLFLALSLGLQSAERDAPAPVRAKPIPTQPVTISEEETPIPRPAARPARATTTRTPSRRPTARQDIVRRIQPVDPHKDSVIQLEAFMVEVRLSALHSQGAPQISQGDDFASAEHILKLMKTTDAAILTTGAKLSLAQANKARTHSTTRKAIHTDPPNNTKTEYIEVGTSFTAIAEIRKEKVFAELEFEYSDVVKDDEKTHAIPQIVERNWGSTVCLKPGEPTLVGAIHDKDTGAFLIVTANIKE